MENSNQLWLNYRKHCNDQETLLEEKYSEYRKDFISHPNYTQELEDYMSFGFDMGRFEEYFVARLDYLKFLEIIKMRQTLFKVECLRFRGYKVSDFDDLSFEDFADESTKSVIAVVNGIRDSSIKEFVESEDLEKLFEIQTRAVDYDSLSIKFNLNKQDEVLFLKIRKVLRDRLLSDQLSAYEKSFLRKIVNDIQNVVKLEYQSIKAEDNKTSLKRTATSEIESNAPKVSRTISMEDPEKVDMAENEPIIDDKKEPDVEKNDQANEEPKGKEFIEQVPEILHTE